MSKNPRIMAVDEANPKAVALVLAADIAPNGRGSWQFFRLSNGDLIFGCYPCGDTYEVVTQCGDIRSKV